MQDLNADWQQHISLNVTQICHCLKLQKGDVSLYLTNHDRVFAFLAETYLADEYLEIQPVKFSQNLADDRFEISTYINADLLSYELIEADFLNQAGFYLYQVNWHKPDEYNLLKTGVVGDILIDKAEIKLSLHGIAKPLEYRYGRLLQEKCDAQFGDNRCSINANLSAYNVSGQVSLVKSAHAFEVTLPSGVDNAYFSNGHLQWQTGDNVNLGTQKLRIVRQFKQSDTQHLIELHHAAKQPIEVSDQLKLTIGCDKSFTTCRDKFANSAGFRGFAQMPGKDFKFAYPQRTVPEE